MKVVDVNPFFYPFMGGIEKRMDRTSTFMAAEGHEVTVVTGRLNKEDPVEEIHNGYHIIRLDSRIVDLYNPPYISSKGLFNVLESLNPDVVNFNYRWAPSYTKDMHRYDGKKVFTYHNTWGEGSGILQKTLSEFNDNRFASVLKEFDHIIAVSDYVRNDLLLRGYASDTVTSIPTGLDRMPATGSGNGKYILSLGRLVRTKGLDYLINAMNAIPHKLILCGKGPEENHIRRLIDKCGVGDRVEMRGFISEEEKDDLMGGCKVFVMPSLFESFGLAAVEAMSFGRPLVCTNVGGLPETVGGGGIVVLPKDSRAIAEAVNRLFDDDRLCNTMAIAAKERSKYYSWNKIMPMIEGVYNKVLSQ